MTAALYSLARMCVRRRWIVLAVWVLVTAVLVSVSNGMGEQTNDNLSLPGTGSYQAKTTLSGSFPAQANGSSPIVLHAKSGKLTEPPLSEAVNKAAAELAKAPHVAGVVNPLTPQGASALSKDQTTGYLSVTLDVSPGALTAEEAARTSSTRPREPAQAAGLEVETGGQLGQKVSKPATESSELFGILAAIVILTFTFGTVTAMMLPIATAIFGLLSTLAIIRMLGHAATVPTVAPTLATMIGLGVGIDYSLFIVTRHLRGVIGGTAGGRGDRAGGGHVGRRRDVRRLDGDDRPDLARRRADPARDDARVHGCDRGARRDARGRHAAARAARGARAPHRSAASAPAALARAGAEGAVGALGRTRSRAGRCSAVSPRSRS